MIQSIFSCFRSSCNNHFLNPRKSVRIHEHVFCSAKTNTFSTEFQSIFDVFWSISVSFYVDFSDFINPVEECIPVIINLSIN